MKRSLRMLGRRMTALLASMVLLAGVLPVQAAGLQMPAAKKAQMEVPSEWLSVNVYSSLKDVKAEDVKVTVTYDGYLGSLKASDLGLAGDGEVPVLKEGSHIQFQIQHKNPMTYYNFCYDGIVLPEDAQPMGWDDCGGGQIYYGSDSEGSFPIQVYGTGKENHSTAQAAGIVNMEEFGTYLGNGTYSYSAVNGLADYAFHSQEARDADGNYQYNDYTINYALGAALTINEQQVEEMEKTGTMTFLAGTPAEYKVAYPGLKELLSNAENAPSFWAEKEVAAAKEAGLVPALVDDPAYQDSTTREQFAQLIVQMITVATGKAMEAAPADTFQDTDSEAVRKAYQAGIINGMGDGTFAPKQTMTREQMATMIHRAISYIEKETGVKLLTKPAVIQGYTDENQVSDWAAEGMKALVANGVINGTSDTTLAPQDPCTVEQGILLLYRLYEKI